MEISNGLKEMSNQLAEEVKSANKDRRVALKLYDKSKNKLQLEKEDKNVLKDELTQALKTHESQQNEFACLLKSQQNEDACLLNTQQAQEQVIEEYKIMLN